MHLPSLFLALCFGVCACAQVQPPQATIFAGSTPCSKDLKPLPGMSANTDCEFAKWRLTLYRNADGQPANYKLTCEYGMTLPNTTQVGNQKQMLNLEGKWIIKKGIYQLQAGNQQISFLVLGNDLLHLLDDKDKLMIGNPGWSFTLNRIK